MKKSEIFTNEEISFICNTDIACEEIFFDFDVNIEKKIDNAISEFIRKEEIKVFEIFEKDDILKRLIKYFKKSKNIKYTNIMKILDITKGTMERLKN